ncbi:sugar ABC transporter permease [Kitasatospora sp. NPDC052896]|uniref:sugar ABC transporter permease n=1 Tax=Kitasatospora sp. NPDC052896 TaxID=3364061 RepID=UPI0037C9B547
MSSTTVPTPQSTPVRPERADRSADPRPVRRRGESSRTASVLSHAALIIASLVAVFPVLWLCYIALGPNETDYLHPGGILGKATLANFGKVLGQTDFFQWFLNSLIVAGGTCVFGVAIAASTGYAVSRMRFPGLRPLMWSLLVTQMFPIAVLIVPMYYLMANLGLLDSYGGLILVYASTAVPYCAWLLKGYFDTIPVEIDEAGRVDGLSPFGTFWRLVLPLARPGLAVAAFYTFLTCWAEVPFASTFMLSSDKYTLAVGLTTFVSQHDSQWNLMAATSVLIALPASAFFYLVQKHLVTGLTAGAAKS